MFTQNVFKAEKVLKNFLKSIFGIKVYADEEGGEEDHQNPPTSPPQVNFEQMIAQARKEEKDKLYPRIKKLEDENKTFVSAQNDLLLKNAALQQEYDKLKNAPNASDAKIKELEETINTLNTEIEELKKSAPTEEKIRKKLEQEYKLKDYLKTKVEENKEFIIPMLVPEVKGSTQEEIDKALESVKEKTLSIKKELGLVDEKGNPITPKAPAPSGRTTPPPANPGTPTPKGFDLEHFKSLDPASAEYAELRKQLKLK